MKNLKKFVVMVLAAMMTLSTFALPTFAAQSTTLTVKGVDANATVKAYQVVTKDANNNWKMVDDYGTPGTGDNAGKWFVKGTQVEYNIEEPSADALAALAKIAKVREKISEDGNIEAVDAQILTEEYDEVSSDDSAEDTEE